MATEQITNLSSGFVNTAIGVADTSISIFGGIWPASGNFRLRIENELLLVTAVSGSGPYTFTVTRGIESTTAASHSVGTYVAEVLTAGSIIQAIKDQITAAGVVTYSNPDQPYPPVLSNFTWLNQSTSTITQDINTLALISPPSNGSEAVCGMYITAPATPYKITARIDVLLPSANYVCAGLFFRNSSAGTISSLCAAYNGNPSLQGYKWNSPTAYSGSTYFNVPWYFYPKWYQISDDGTNRKYSVSQDGQTFIDLYSVSRTDFLTADTVGFFVNNNQSSSGESAGLYLQSWQVH